MTDLAARLREKNINLRENEPLSAHTTFRIGGAADIFAEPKNEEELAWAVEAARETDTRLFVIGKGSNLLFSDKGFRGAVISLAHLSNIDVSGRIVTAGCGASLSGVALAAWRASLDGARFLFGIPGSVGGGVYMNAGAFGGEIGDVLISSRYYDTTKGAFFTLDNDGHEFSYRHSSYMLCPERVIVSACLALKQGRADEIKAGMDEIMNKRKATQPLEYPSAGSVFKRVDGIPVARLIDEAGLKGTRVGGAEISEKHAGFIVNRGGATADDVLRLIEIVRKKIYELHGIDIECEVRRVGEE